MWERGIARHGYEVFKEGQAVGHVTSGSYTPTLEKAVGLAFVPPSCSEPGTILDIRVRDRFIKAQVAALPFYKRKKQYAFPQILA
jgi:aminomethyltransferase